MESKVSEWSFLALSYLQREGMTMLSVCALEERASDKKREETGVVDESEVK